jgi:hypothetical protein
LGDLSRGQDWVVDQARPATLADDLDGFAEPNDRQHFDGLGQERPGDDGADVDLVHGHGGLRPGRTGSSLGNGAVANPMRLADCGQPS